MFLKSSKVFMAMFEELELILFQIKVKIYWTQNLVAKGQNVNY